MTRAWKRRSGVTLVELLVYLALCTTAIVVIGGVELAATRSVALQRALVDIELQANGYLGSLRKDVLAARSIDVEREGGRTLLRIVRLDGIGVAYTPGERLELDESGRVRGRQAFGRVADLQVTRETGGRVSITLELAVPVGRSEVRRTYRRWATPRREVKGG